MSLIFPDKFNAAEYFIDRHMTEGRGNKVAIEGDGFRVTYRDLFFNVNRMGNALRALGLKRGDRVALVLLDKPEFAYAFFGAIKMGAIPIPINTSLTEKEYEYFLGDSGARVAIVDEQVLPKIQAVSREKAPCLEYVFAVGAVPAGAPFRSLREILDEASMDLQAAETTKEDVAFWLYSSGSTGAPKACVHRERDMVVCSEHYAKNILHMSQDDRCFSVSKLFFAYGLGNALYYPLAVGATSILLSGKPTPGAVMDVLRRYKPTLFFSVPVHYSFLLASEPAIGDLTAFASVRECISAGEALPAALFYRFKERFGHEILDGIGSTESLQAFITNVPHEVRPGSSGKVIPGYEVKIQDDAGLPVRRGTVGNLFVKNDAICAYYFNKPEKTKETLVDGWLKTGDRYYEDEDGYFWHQGRSDDMIRSNGMWVSPIEVEEVFMRHPAVREAAVVGREDAQGLIHPVAYISLHPNFAASPELAHDLKEFTKSRLPNYKCPRRIEFVAALPRTATGKIQRFKLREGREKAITSEAASAL